MLVETRAKGGNLLLNIGPTPQGEIPPEQGGRLNELGLWIFINREAIYDIRPWHTIREGDIWFTRARDENTVYAIVTNIDWDQCEDVAGNGDADRTFGRRIHLHLQSVRATADTEVEVLGHAGEVIEYRENIDPSPQWTQDEESLHISVMSAHRIYNAWDWKNPMTVKITHAEAG